MKILAVDPGVTQAGFAVYTPDHPEREKGIICSSYSSSGSSSEKKAEDFARHFEWLIHHYQPDVICFELAVRQIFQYQRKADLGGLRTEAPSSDQLILSELQGSIRGIAIAHAIPFDSVPVQTWRAAIYGKGGGNMPRDQAKSYAKTMARRLGIKFLNHNEAEASMVSLWCATCSQIYKAKLYGVAI
jgi:hypothetical protein